MNKHDRATIEGMNLFADILPTDDGEQSEIERDIDIADEDVDLEAEAAR